MTVADGVTYGYDSLDRVGVRAGIPVFYSGLSDRAVYDHAGISTALSPDGSPVADVADATARDALRLRGGGAVNTRVLADHMGFWTVREIGEAAAAGNKDAAAWLKMIKQAGSQGKGGK